MSTPQINITIGTAGHIDHGKTSLVKLLTGCNTDRLKAEQDRGMSIDLGFAPCKIRDREVGIVDVPGHENFIKTMVAGAAAMDGVMLVVAADDGVMPQTREHMEILTLLGVRHGFVAMTKIDRVDDEHRELVIDETRAFLQGTFLEASPICCISNVTGEGLDDYFKSLDGLLAQIRPRPTTGLFRMPLDRAFSVQGHGTVIAGVPVSGSARIGDEVVALSGKQKGSSRLKGRIRRIEVYGRPADAVLAGQCAAINIGGWESQQLGRGDCVTVPDMFETALWFVCKLKMLPRQELKFKSGAKVRFHTGTTETNATLYLLESDLVQPGDEQIVQIRTNQPITAHSGDFFIIRSLSPVQTVGGGMVVESVPGRLRRTRSGLIDDLRDRAESVTDDFQFVEYTVRNEPVGAITLDQIVHRVKLPRERAMAVVDQLVQAGQLMPLGSTRYIHRDVLARLVSQIIEVLQEFHAAQPQSPGMTLDELRGACPAMDRAVLDELLRRMLAGRQIMQQAGRYADSRHEATFSSHEARAVEAIESAFRDHLFKPPGIEPLVEKTGISAAEVERLIKTLIQHRRLVKIESLVFHADAVERAREIALEHFAKEERLESVRFKYLLDTTRKFALPVLDHLDRIGVTKRVGNTRYLRQK